jgi:hypothetical protein
MLSKKIYNTRNFISKKKYKGGTKCNKYPHIWSFDNKCLKQCPANTCSSYNGELICRSLKDNCIITKIKNNKLLGDIHLYKSDGYLFQKHLIDSYTNKPYIRTSLYYGKIVEKTDENNKMVINKEGLGLLIDTDNNIIYYGNFKDNNRSGYGKIIWSTNNYYEGEWKHDQIHGNGKLRTINGYIYDGETVYGVKHGKGKYTTVDGEVYDGEWKDGVKHGKGKYTTVDGEVYDGEWKDGRKDGYGVFLFNNNDEYKGYFKEDTRHGQGVYKWNNGNAYDGEWRNGNYNGWGKFIFKSGIYYEGNWEDNKLNGLVNIYYNNSILTGTYVKGIRQGEFTNKLKNGKIKKYFFIDGKLYNFEKNVSKYYLSNPYGKDESKHITILIHLHGADLINSVCNLNKSKHVRVISPVLCGVTNLVETHGLIDSFNIAYNITHLQGNDLASSHQKMIKIIEIFNEHMEDFYDLKQGSYIKPIIDHRYSIDDEDLFQIYVIDTNFNSPELFQKGEFEVITEKNTELKVITDISQFNILPKLIDYLIIDIINGYECFLRSDVINVLLDFGYDTINIIDFSCRAIDEEIIKRDYNETSGKNYQCKYIVNPDESTYLGDEVKSFQL